MTREEAIDILRVINPPRESKRIFDEFMQARDMAIKALEQPERKTARWIDKGWDGDANFRIDGRGDCWRVHECSNCHEQIEGAMTKYCSNCGADMKGDADD